MTVSESIAKARVSGPDPQPDGVMKFEFRFDPADSVFGGHFPGRALLPGVFQLEIARAAAQWALGCRLEVREIRKAKFLRPIVPGELIRLELKTAEDDGGVVAQAGFSVFGQRAGETVMRLCRNAG